MEKNSKNLAKTPVIVKLTDNERKVLSYLIKNSRLTDSDIASNMKLSVSSVSRIRERLADKGVIKAYTLEIDFEKLGIECYVLVFYSATSKWWEKINEKGVKKIAQSPYLVSVFRTNEKNLSYITLYGFKNNQHANAYFNEVQRIYNDFLVIEKIIFLSNSNIIKNDNSSLLDIFSLEADEVSPNSQLFNSLTR